MSDKIPSMKTDRDASQQPTASRFGRFARMSGLTAGVTARHLGQKMMGVFQSDEQKQVSATEAQRKSAQQITKTLGELKGAAMKVGQMMATDPELLPPEMIAEISSLQHSAPAMSFDVVKGVVEQALGQPLAAVFSQFSAEPIGAASIGQVHRATLTDGTDVAVKVQYPGIADTIHSDMGNLGSLLNLLRLNLPRERVDAYLDEFTKVIQAESDYLQEAINLERFCVLFKSLPGVRVPAPVHELTRRNVLVMEFIDGVRLDGWLASAPQAQKDAQGRRLIEIFLQSVHRNQVLHADPHPGNFLVLHNAPLVDGAPPLCILDAGCVRVFDAAFTDKLIGFQAAMWRHDLDALQASWRGLGFIDLDIDPEVIYEWNELILAPLLEDRPFDFGTWKIQDDAMTFMLAHPRVKLWSPPRELVFYVRTLVGLRGLLAKTGLTVNVYQLARAMAEERGVLKASRH
jgi:predicted unusual protein kinase regulating ubiquinone biosynthesis (AarF/ABC1/UbiB family)